MEEKLDKKIDNIADFIRIFYDKIPNFYLLIKDLKKDDNGEYYEVIISFYTEKSEFEFIANVKCGTLICNGYSRVIKPTFKERIVTSEYNDGKTYELSEINLINLIVNCYRCNLVSFWDFNIPRNILNFQQPNQHFVEFGSKEEYVPKPLLSDKILLDMLHESLQNEFYLSHRHSGEYHVYPAKKVNANG